jgi:hypothetical protein
VSLAQLVLGIDLLVLAAACVLGRERVVARARGRAGFHVVQPPTAFVVVGVILAVVGVAQVALAVR